MRLACLALCVVWPFSVALLFMVKPCGFLQPVTLATVLMGRIAINALEPSASVATGSAKRVMSGSSALRTVIALQACGAWLTHVKGPSSKLAKDLVPITAAASKTPIVPQDTATRTQHLTGHALLFPARLKPIATSLHTPLAKAATATRSTVRQGKLTQGAHATNQTTVSPSFATHKPSHTGHVLPVLASTTPIVLLANIAIKAPARSHDRYPLP